MWSSCPVYWTGEPLDPRYRHRLVRNPTSARRPAARRPGALSRAWTATDHRPRRSVAAGRSDPRASGNDDHQDCSGLGIGEDAEWCIGSTNRMSSTPVPPSLRGSGLWPLRPAGAIYPTDTSSASLTAISAILSATYFRATSKVLRSNQLDASPIFFKKTDSDSSDGEALITLSHRRSS